ncbi:hypothetical protein BW14_08495 [Bifidobacterium sp. UTBIF-68]|uniref:SpaA isopeptide-forming pilin-related protein n=1 Tax=Bifidobacterium sp. UTBIF-68 TaxID=1465262 RepID=UPI00112ABF05|nr:SpaA isopeptide-forming pilin-related protein [Bifidobacterium sp. UTBIF-68]TPF92568.1 hypothetical protein BW14_08495 [Bifidobacterium sp. UTBIF-68]
MGLTVTAGTASDINGRDLVAIKVGSYVGATIDNNPTIHVTSLEVGATGDNGIDTAVKTALDAVDPDWATTSPEYRNNPIAYVAAKYEDSGSPTWSGTLRKFVDKLAEQQAVKDAAGTALTTSPTGSTATVRKLSQGLYLILDRSTAEQLGDRKAGIPMFVGTGVDYINTNGQPFGYPGANEFADGSRLGFVDLKAENTNISKDSDKDLDGTVQIGDTVTYTLQSIIPNTANMNASADPTVQNPAADAFTYRLIDTPGTGLTVKAGTTPTVTVIKDINDPTKNETLDAAKDFTLTGWPAADADVEGNGTTQMIIDLSKWAWANGKRNDYAGKTIKVTYQATVNSSASKTVDNKFKVSNNDKEATNSLKTFDFAFTKVGGDNKTPLKGATFTVYTDQDYTTAYQQNGADVTATSGDDGVVAFKGFKAGTYWVKETVIPTGYMQQVVGKLKVDINRDGTITITDESGLGLYTDANANVGNAHTVKNVTSLTQLPLTGAAGTALFTVVGVLLAGAGVTVYLRTRRMKKQLVA